MNSQTFEKVAGPALILALLTLVALYVRPLTPIDETRYVSVAWEMWLRDEYLVLFKNGETYSHKPPLLFWLYNLGWAVFGINEWWPRLVSPLFSFGGLLLTLSIARRLWPDAGDSHRNALWILGASLLWMVFSTSAMFDVMLAFFVLLGMRGLLIAADGAMKRGFAWLAFAIGMGVLAKGPVVLLHLLPAAVLAPWWAGGGLDWKRWYGAILLAVLGGAAIALAWAIPAAIHGGEEYRNAIFWGQTANRMVDSFAHKRPLWWYLPLLPLLLFPWLVWPGLWRRLLAARREGLDLGLRFCLAWMAPVFIAFSFISGKQIHYLIPLFPAFALFAGHLFGKGRSGPVWLPVLLSAAVGAVMLYFAWSGLPEKLSIWGELPWWPGAALIAAALAAWWAGRAENLRLPALAALGACLFALVQIYIAPGAARSYDMHPMAGAIKSLQDRGITVANVGRYHAQFHFAGRLEKPLVQLAPGELPGWLAQNPEAALVVYVNRRIDLRESLFSQPYRGETAVLMSAEQARRQLAALNSGKKGKALRLPEGEEE
ncbi:glycosyltransferase family 39 protein [Betaproteobacteria bacterium SCN2]|nr:glycosyltransferase family 39 protein [Betaproteobacteria bacterium SCN2]